MRPFPATTDAASSALRRVRWRLATILLSSLAAHAADTCETPQHRALDFWLGTWVVKDEGKAVATSRIERGPGGCVIVEHYRQDDGYEGMSESFYDSALERWRQTWVDSTGAVGEFSGELVGREMRFTGETHRADGTRIYRRMTLAPEGTGVRQTSLASRDGRAWKPHYELHYWIERAAQTPGSLRTPRETSDR